VYPTKTRVGSSSTVATVQRFNHFELRAFGGLVVAWRFPHHHRARALIYGLILDLDLDRARIVFHIGNYVIGYTERHLYLSGGLTLDSNKVIQGTELTPEVALAAYQDGGDIDRVGIGWVRVDVIAYEAHNTDPH
jgi:hypothetical protein